MHKYICTKPVGRWCAAFFLAAGLVLLNFSVQAREQIQERDLQATASSPDKTGDQVTASAGKSDAQSSEGQSGFSKGLHTVGHGFKKGTQATGNAFVTAGHAVGHGFTKAGGAIRDFFLGKKSSEEAQKSSKPNSRKDLMAKDINKSGETSVKKTEEDLDAIGNDDFSGDV